MTEDQQRAIATMRAAMMDMIEGMNVFTDAVVGFRANLEAAGYSPTMAEQIAGELHRQLIVSTFDKMRSND